MLFYLYFDSFYWAFTQKTKLFSVPFERDLQKIAKINSQQEKPVFSNRNNQFPQNTKNRQSAKLNSRKNLVPHGSLKSRGLPGERN